MNTPDLDSSDRLRDIQSLIQEKNPALLGPSLNPPRLPNFIVYRIPPI
jgi:hypothetical protein